ncbi:MAG: hypothetical protein KDK65_06775, partial [Chlamydiia bacterium]|nr:hypothetical protein [Chlamydiia bacterium]
MNWLRDNQENVEPWQVEDYRSLSLKQLFERLSERQIHLDQERFFEAAQSFDSPEDLVDAIGQSLNVAGKELDAVYLLIFELWRRLLPEKQSLSLLCDELDNLIHAYDQGNLFHLEKLQDALANLVVVIEDNAEEEEEDPATLFNAVMQNLANDLVAFLYDMITDQIDLGEVDYAEELYE